MKRIALPLLILLFFAIPVLCLAQADNEKPNYEYQPLVQNGAWWLRIYNCSDGKNLLNSSTLHKNYFEGDTIINNKIYNIFYNTESNDNEYYREINKIIYGYEWNSNESIIFDFNKAIGDSIYLYNSNYPSIIVSEDSLLLMNNTFVRGFNIENIQAPWSYYEGIGSINNEFHPFFKTTNTCLVELLAYGINNQVLYSILDNDLTSYDELYDYIYANWPININKLETPTISIYPNPAHNIISIESDLRVSLINIYSIEGKRVLQFNNKSELDISSLQKGIYLITIELEGGKRLTKRIIKQ